MTIRGADRVRRQMGQLRRNLDQELAKANKNSGRYIIKLAKAAHPGDGATRASITGRVVDDGAFLVDFGPKAKVTEGSRGPRPYANPALKAAENKNARRYKRAVNKAVKLTFGV